MLVTHLCCRYEQFETWGSTLTQMSPSLRQIRSVRRSLTCTTLLTLVHALVVTKVDYCSSVLSDISGQLRSGVMCSDFLAQNTRRAAGLKTDCSTPLLCELHWLKVSERIQFQLCVLANRCIISTEPSYLAETLHLTADVVHVGVFGVLLR